MTFIGLVLGVFSVGLYGLLTRRDIIAVLASVEVMLGSASIMLVGLSATTTIPAAGSDPGITGSVGLVMMVLAAAEASIGLALLLAVARRVKTARLDELQEVKG